MDSVNYDFNVNYDVVVVEDILAIHKYLINKNGIVWIV